MGNIGIKVTQYGEEATKALTAGTKELFQVLSTDGCLLEKEKSATPSATNMFHGYILTPDEDYHYYFGAIKTVTIANGGSGYTPGFANISGGDSNAVVQIFSVDGGGSVTQVYMSVSGSGYEVAPGVSTTGGGGTGLTLNITSVTTSDSVRAHPLNYGVGNSIYVIFENAMPS